MKNMITIRRFFRIPAIATCLTIALGACSGLLDEETYDQYDGKYYFQSIPRLEMAVNGVYATLQSPTTYGQYIWAVSDNDTDLSHIKSPGIDNNTTRQLGHYYIQSNNTILESMWKAYYTGIKNANVVLANYRDVPATTEEDAAQVARLVAETRFLRGLMYFDLVRLWGDVPIPLVPAAIDDDFDLPRSDRFDVYDQIVEDMSAAVDDLPWYDETAYDGRVTKSAAIGMLVRVNLFRGGYSLHQDGVRRRAGNYLDYYDEALGWANKLIESKKHSLNPDYAQIFKNNCQYVLEPKECIFEVEMYFLLNSYSSGAIGTYNGISASTSSLYMKSAPYVGTHWLAYSKFGEGDLRRDISIANFSLDKTGQPSIIENKNSQQWNIRKWSREWQTKDQFESQSNTGINYVVLRYADILLMKAEILNEQNGGPTDEAFELVNQIRRRGYGKPANIPDPSVDMPKDQYNSREAFLAYIQDERARELMFESMIRKQDLIRWNILGDKVRSLQTFVGEQGGKNVKKNFDFTAARLFTDNKHELYPIPQRELRENKALKQNPHYSD